MAARKRMSRKELKQADPLYESLERVGKKLVAHKVEFIAGVVGLVVVLASAGAYSAYTESKKKERAGLVASAFAALSAPVGTEAVAGAKGEAFIDEEARRKAVAERMAALEERYGDSALGDVGAWLKAARGVSDGDKGPDQAAIKALGALGGQASGLGPWIELARGRSAWDAGDKDGARKAYEVVASNADLGYSVRALARMAIADLDNPQVGGEGGDFEKARAAYREVLSMVDGADEREPALTAIRNEAALRLALLPGGHKEVLEPPKPEPEEAEAEEKADTEEKAEDKAAPEVEEKAEGAKPAEKEGGDKPSPEKEGEKAAPEDGAKDGKE